MGLFNFFSKKSGEEYYQEGEAFWEKEEYAEAYMCYCEAAKQRHPGAQYSIGYCMRNGIACQKDIPTAIFWLEKAIKQGHVRAMLELAYIYDDKENGYYNKQKAIEWYTRAANLGNASAEFNLAFFYHSGDGVEQDIAKACALWKSAADKGHESAKHNYEVVTYSENDLQAVALDYIYGRNNCEKDIPKGIELLQKGIELDNDGAYLCYGLVKMAGVEPYITKSFEEGFSLLLKSAKMGCTEAFFDIMLMYQNGHIEFEGHSIGPGEKNMDIARRYAVEIADAFADGSNADTTGEWRVFGEAAYALLFGCGVEVNIPKAVDYIQRVETYHRNIYPAKEVIEELTRRGYTI